MHWNHFENCDDKPRSAGRKAARIVGLAVIGVFFAAIFALLFGFVVKWLWNWLMPGIFGLAEIGYWQAFGLVILAKLLFGGFGHGPHGHSRYRTRPLREKAADGSSRCHGFERARDYARFWREEGKAAFESWLSRVHDGADDRQEETVQEEDRHDSGEGRK